MGYGSDGFFRARRPSAASAAPAWPTARSFDRRRLADGIARPNNTLGRKIDPLRSGPCFAWRAAKPRRAARRGARGAVGTSLAMQSRGAVFSSEAVGVRPKMERPELQVGGASTGALRAARRQSAVDSARRIHRRRWASAPKGLVEIGFGWLAAFCDFCAVALAAAASNTIYKLATFGLLPDVEPVTEVGAVVGVLVVISNIQRNEYAIRRFETFSGHFGRCVSVWNLAFFCVFALGFATKTTAPTSVTGSTSGKSPKVASL